MGRLIFKNDLNKDALELDPSWYFTRVYWDSNSACKFEWPSLDYPHKLSIHSDHIKGNQIKIRKWIENNILDTVIYDIDDKSHWIKMGTYDGYKRHNEWFSFYFEDSQSALAFKLQFMDLVSEVTDKHPGWPDD